jgi:hypothetical protein
MISVQTTAHYDTRQGPFRWTRLDTAHACADFADPCQTPTSQRHYAQQHDIPRATLGYWLRQHAPDDLDPELVAFLRRPAGESFLRRLVLALLLVFPHSTACGLRPLGRFLQLTGLDHFVAPSYGALYQLAAHVQNDLGTFDDQERPRLAAQMAPKDIVLCGDENFHGPQACLVAIEPVSNFLLAETYREHRDGPTWTAVIQQATGDLPVTILRLTSDQARGLLACARDGLEVPHGPDLFHGQREVARPLLGALHRQGEAAAKGLAQAEQDLRQVQDEEQAYQAQPPRPGRRRDFAPWIELRRSFVGHAAQKVQACAQRQDEARQAVRGLADDLHPFDSQSGAPLQARQVERRLEKRLTALERVAVEAGLGAKAEAAVGKVRGWLPALVAGVAWFWALARQRVEELGLPAAAEQAVYRSLLPGLYWEQAAPRGRDAAQRQQLRALAARLQEQAWQAGGALAGLAASERAAVAKVAREVAVLFVRSSSCVEGRNGRLSLHHHGQGRLSAGRLKALTVVHNYVVVGEDGTTAAERFFGSKPRDVFGWLLARLPDLPRPAAKRPKAVKQAAIHGA